MIINKLLICLFGIENWYIFVLWISRAIGVVFFYINSLYVSLNWWLCVEFTMRVDNSVLKIHKKYSIFVVNFLVSKIMNSWINGRITKRSRIEPTPFRRLVAWRHKGNPLYTNSFDKDSLSPAKFQIWVHQVSTGLVGRSSELFKKEVVMAKDISARLGYKLVFTPYVTRNGKRVYRKNGGMYCFEVPISSSAA